ncbi:hypothetical protein GGF41_006810 [Coemansia sp. RSA 2531]|nr:hypothetical protein GGF41_006810 [Coemansia sp. RSA 2531]
MAHPTTRPYPLACPALWTHLLAGRSDIARRTSRVHIASSLLWWLAGTYHAYWTFDNAYSRKCDNNGVVDTACYYA